VTAFGQEVGDLFELESAQIADLPFQFGERIGVSLAGFLDYPFELALMILADGEVAGLGERLHIAFLSGHPGGLGQFRLAEDGRDIGR